MITYLSLPDTLRNSDEEWGPTLPGVAYEGWEVMQGRYCAYCKCRIYTSRLWTPEDETYVGMSLVCSGCGRYHVVGCMKIAV